MQIFHKNTCITCKRAISELERMKKDLIVRDFFKDPFSESELENIIAKAKINPQQMLRKRDKMYRELNLENSKKTDSQLIKLMIKHPGLIKRPIIVSEDKIIVGKADLENL